MKKTIIYSLLFVFLFGGILHAQTTVYNTTELNAAISSAGPGTTIILANGTWTDVQISIQKTGTMSNPITIQAQTPGSVFFEGKCYVKMGGAFIVFEGVVFQNPSNLSTGTPLIDFKASMIVIIAQLLI